LQDEKLAQELGEAGSRSAARFTFEQMMDGYQAVYQKVTDRRTKETYEEQPARSAKREGTAG
jgi:hypothetical protein